MVNPVGASDNRPLKKVLISGVNITVLPDSGAMVSAMDEATFRGCGLDKQLYGASTEAHLLLVLGSFKALTESKTKMKVVTWQSIKGNTQTAPLLSYEDGKDLGMILMTNVVSDESRQDPSEQSKGMENVNGLLEEYKDRFVGIGKLKGVQVDLNVDPGVKPVTQPPRRQPFSIRQKMEEELQHLLEQDIIEKVNEPTGWVAPPVVTPKKDQSQI